MSVSSYYSYLYDGNKLNDLILNKKYSKDTFYKLFWDVCQGFINIHKIKQLIEISKKNDIQIDLTKFNNIAFRSACLSNNIELAKFLLKVEPKINTRDSNDSSFINACWENYLIRTHESIIMLLIEKNPYTYSYSFETRVKKINTPEEEKEARWKTKRDAILTSSRFHPNDTLLYKIPDDLSRIVIQFLYK